MCVVHCEMNGGDEMRCVGLSIAGKRDFPMFGAWSLEGKEKEQEYPLDGWDRDTKAGMR